MNNYNKDWYLRDRQFQLCDVRYMSNNNGNCVVMGKVNSFLSQLDEQVDLYVQWWAANKPTYTCSQSGFCIPYPNEAIAFQNTPNYGVIPVRDKKFKFDIEYPSGYYKKLGSRFIQPQINFRFCDKESRPVSKVYILKLTNFQQTERPAATTAPTTTSDEPQTQYIKLLQKGLTRPNWSM